MLEKNEIERLKREVEDLKKEGVHTLKHLGKKALGRPLRRNLFGVPAYNDCDWQMKVLKLGLDDHSGILGKTCWEVLVQYALDEILGREFETRAAMRNVYSPDGSVQDMFQDTFERIDDKDEGSFRPMVEAAVNFLVAHDARLRKDAVGYDFETCYASWQLYEIREGIVYGRAKETREAIAFVKEVIDFNKALDAGEAHPIFPLAQAACDLWDVVGMPSVFYRLFACLMALAEPCDETAMDRFSFMKTSEKCWKAHREHAESH